MSRPTKKPGASGRASSLKRHSGQGWHMRLRGGDFKAAVAERVRCPTPERAERLATELDGARRHLIQARQAIQREAAGGSPAK